MMIVASGRAWCTVGGNSPPMQKTTLSHSLLAVSDLDDIIDDGCGSRPRVGGLQKHRASSEGARYAHLTVTRKQLPPRENYAQSEIGGESGREGGRYLPHRLIAVVFVPLGGCCDTQRRRTKHARFKCPAEGRKHARCRRGTAQSAIRAPRTQVEFNTFPF